MASISLLSDDIRKSIYQTNFSKLIENKIQKLSLDDNIRDIDDKLLFLFEKYMMHANIDIDFLFWFLWHLHTNTYQISNTTQLLIIHLIINYLSTCIDITNNVTIQKCLQIVVILFCKVSSNITIKDSHCPTSNTKVEASYLLNIWGHIYKYAHNTTKFFIINHLNEMKSVINGAHFEKLLSLCVPQPVIKTKIMLKTTLDKH